ncbi:MAG TPA: BON domain-containing protein [Burkholderiales bacterium]|nr:BON domain-containing protein [Burkholderiales bacterium]
MTYPKIVALTMTAAALALGGCASHREASSPPPSRSVGEYSSDAALTAKVKTAIASATGLGNAVNINVQTNRGVVQLNGFVESQDKIERATEVAREVDGVRSVENNLQVKPSS